MTVLAYRTIGILNQIRQTYLVHIYYRTSKHIMFNQKLMYPELGKLPQEQNTDFGAALVAWTRRWQGSEYRCYGGQIDLPL